MLRSIAVVLRPVPNIAAQSTLVKSRWPCGVTRNIDNATAFGRSKLRTMLGLGRVAAALRNSGRGGAIYVRRPMNRDSRNGQALVIMPKRVAQLLMRKPLASIVSKRAGLVELPWFHGITPMIRQPTLPEPRGSIQLSRHLLLRHRAEIVDVETTRCQHRLHVCRYQLSVQAGCDGEFCLCQLVNTYTMGTNKP